MRRDLSLGTFYDFNAQLEGYVKSGLIRKKMIDGHRCYFPQPDYDARLDQAKRIIEGGRA